MRPRSFRLAGGHPGLTPANFDEAAAAELPDDPPFCAEDYGGYACTRRPGHAGLHVASGYAPGDDDEEVEEIYAVWGPAEETCHG